MGGAGRRGLGRRRPEHALCRAGRRGTAAAALARGGRGGSGAVHGRSRRAPCRRSPAWLRAEQARVHRRPWRHPGPPRPGSARHRQELLDRLRPLRPPPGRHGRRPGLPRLRLLQDPRGDRRPPGERGQGAGDAARVRRLSPRALRRLLRSALAGRPPLPPPTARRRARRRDPPAQRRRAGVRGAEGHRVHRGVALERGGGDPGWHLRSDQGALAQGPLRPPPRRLPGPRRGLADEPAGSGHGRPAPGAGRPADRRRRPPPDAADRQARLGQRAAPHVPGVPLLRVPLHGAPAARATDGEIRGELPAPRRHGRVPAAGGLRPGRHRLPLPSARGASRSARPATTSSPPSLPRSTRSSSSSTTKPRARSATASSNS